MNDRELVRLADQRAQKSVADHDGYADGKVPTGGGGSCRYTTRAGVGVITWIITAVLLRCFYKADRILAALSERDSNEREREREQGLA